MTADQKFNENMMTFEAHVGLRQFNNQSFEPYNVFHALIRVSSP